MISLKEVPVTDIKGIGEKSAKLLQKLDIESVKDLLEYYPRDYIKMPEIKKISDLNTGEIAAVKAKVRGDFFQKSTPKMTIASVSATDGTGILNLVFFRQNYLKNILKVGSEFVFYGKVSMRGTKLFFEMPRIIKCEEYEFLLQTLNPVYPLTKGLTSKALSKYIRTALDSYVPIPDPLPEEIRVKHNLLSAGESCIGVHFPVCFDSFVKAREGIVFREFYEFFTELNKRKTESVKSGFPMIHTALCERFLETLPFEMTNAQKRVYEEICDDLSGEYVMNRLVQGDVGSGKTLIAFLALLDCAANGYQGVVMAPTEVLAEQHYKSFTEWAKGNDIVSVTLLTGSIKGARKKEILAGIKDGSFNIIVGTQALFQEGVVYSKLALVVCDEQHRFGVKERDKLADKSMNPHILSMSATPIPRTLASALYCDMQVSDIDEMPAKRLPIKSCVIPSSKRASAFAFVEKEVSLGHQVYIICPMIEENESIELENVLSYTADLKSRFDERMRIGCLHGRMKSEDKNRIMSDYAAGNIDVLVSTTVIEVGVNVPNATVMIIENADRFGLAQLHQLRGRVGRGDCQSFCIFINSSEEENERLDVLVKSNDGFFIAREDLRLRGPGDLLGIRQSGIMKFKMADVFQDYDLLMDAKDEADKITHDMV